MASFPPCIRPILHLTFRTLGHTSAVILEESSVEGVSGAIDRRFHTR